jgi:hypothetical protein
MMSLKRLRRTDEIEGLSPSMYL